MKPSLLKITKALALLSFLYLAACAPSSSTTTMNAAGGGNSNTGSGTPANCSTTSAGTGKIYDPSYQSNPSGFRTAVVDFVSATLPSSSMGDVSGNPNASTGITFSGVFAFDGSGQVNVSSTSLSMDIYDSLVGTINQTTGKPITAYPIDFAGAKSGSYNKAAGTFTVVFEDNYGSVAFEGTVKGSVAQGLVKYANKNNVNGGAAKSGTLGTFTINTCSLIK